MINLSSNFLSIQNSSHHLAEHNLGNRYVRAAYFAPLVCRGLLSISKYTYDANGRLTEKTDRNGRVTTYTYDAAGRLTSESWLGR